MKRLPLIAIPVWFVLIAGCEDLGTAPPLDGMVNCRGTIIQMGAQTFLVRTDSPFAGTDLFYPMNLPERFRKDGQRIRFSAKIDIPPHARLRWTPIRFTSIMPDDVWVF